ncbi:MAG: ABC transporter ATP-binding protein [Pseudomonadota bacterium]|nr:ABC transporter ATP-binding protein [Pseudomonadota bacterium]
MTLAAQGLDFGYPRRVVGRGLDLALGEGEVLCVLGPNGAGKTTLLRTLLGLLPPLAGRVTLDGRDLACLDRARVARGMAYVPQAASVVFDFTLQEMVEMGRAAHLAAYARPSSGDRRIARAALERLGIGDLAQRAFGAVSGGERQLALLARALASEARCMVMDEPTAHLDFANQTRVLHEIGRMAGGGIAILLCSHDPDHAFAIADRALLLDRGQAAALGDASAVLTAQNLSRLYGVTIHVADVPTEAGLRRVCVPAAAA